MEGKGDEIIKTLRDVRRVLPVQSVLFCASAIAIAELRVILNFRPGRENLIHPAQHTFICSCNIQTPTALAQQQQKAAVNANAVPAPRGRPQSYISSWVMNMVKG